MPITTLPDYPASPGSKPETIVNITGPSSYTQVTVGSPPTGGQVVTARDLGLVSIEFASGMGSDDGAWSVRVIPSLASNTQGTSSIILCWISNNTGGQVSGATNLSSRTVRLLVKGR